MNNAIAVQKPAGGAGGAMWLACEAITCMYQATSPPPVAAMTTAKTIRYTAMTASP